jgi:hypothetical protein
MKQLVEGSPPLLLFALLSIFHLPSTAFSLVCLDLILASPRSPCLLTFCSLTGWKVHYQIYELRMDYPCPPDEFVKQFSVLNEFMTRNA